MELPTRERLPFYHLRHEHPLEYKNSVPPQPQDMHCSGCKLNVLPGMGYYNCKTCPLVLHRVCYNMPHELQHPAHANHPLTRLDATSNSTFASNHTCRACGHRINGLYYSCNMCHVFYHILCSALPLNVSINNHPHILKLEFSLPYEFQCDLCSKSSHEGWVYRCSLCEFDTHLSCAILNQREGSYQHSPVFPAADEVLRASDLSRASDTEWTNDFKVTVRKELTKLVAQNMVRGVVEGISQRNLQRKAAEHTEVQNPNLTKENLGVGNGRNLNSKFSQNMSNTIEPSVNVEQSQNEGKPALISLDLATPSYQFSDAYFSIDLAKSYSTVPEKSQTKKETKHQDPAVIPRTKEEESSTKFMAASTHKHEPATGFSFENKAPDGRLNEALFFDWGSTYSTKHMNQTERNRNVVGAMARSDTGIQIDTSEATGSCWAKFFGCCCQRNYKQMFKHGGS